MRRRLYALRIRNQNLSRRWNVERYRGELYRSHVRAGADGYRRDAGVNRAVHLSGYGYV